MRRYGSQPELALRYLLQLSSDIRAAYLLDERGSLIAAAPAEGGGVDKPVSELAQLVRGLPDRAGKDVEVDVLCQRESVLVLSEQGHTLICVAERNSLPGIVLHEMRSTLSDLDVVSRPAAEAE